MSQPRRSKNRSEEVTTPLLTEIKGERAISLDAVSWTRAVELTTALPRPPHPELLVSLKPSLRVPLLPNVPSTNLINILNSIASAADSLTEYCTKKVASHNLRAGGGDGHPPAKPRLRSDSQDYLDGEGVNIWNRSAGYRHHDHEEVDQVYGASESMWGRAWRSKHP